MANSITPLAGFATAAPTDTNTFAQVGDMVRNSAPAKGSPAAWVCTVEGRPGTWVALDGPADAAEFNTTVSITNAELLAIRATPKTLVAAPGAGKMLQFVSAVLLLDYTAPGFTETADNLAIRYTDGSGSIVSQAIECTGFIDQTADTSTTAWAKIDAIVAKSGCENKALVLHNTGDGEWANSGGSTMRVNITYRVLTTSW